MTGRCRDCRWWNAPYADEWSGWSECERDTYPVTPESPVLMVSDGDILTAPEFGCVQWEARNK